MADRISGRKRSGLLPANITSPIAMEKRLERLETAVAVLGVTSIGLAAYIASTRFGVLRARVVEAEHLQLTHPSSSVMQTIGINRRVPAGEFGVRRGRPELRLLDGHVSLMDGNRRVRVQMDASYRPAPPVRKPTAVAARGQQLMRPYANLPVVLFNDETEAPAAVLDAVRGMRPAPAKHSAENGVESSVDNDDGSVAGWAASLLVDADTSNDSASTSLGQRSSASEPHSSEDGFGMSAMKKHDQADNEPLTPKAKPSWEQPRSHEDDRLDKPQSVVAELESERSEAAQHRS